MTKVTVTNNRANRYGVEIAGGGYRFVKPGGSATVDAANLGALDMDGVSYEVAAEVGAPPARLASKAKDVGKKAPGRTRRRRRSAK